MRPIPRALQTGYRRVFGARLLGFGHALGALGATFLSVSDPPHCTVRSSSVQPPTCFAEINDDLNVKLSRYSSLLSTSPKNFIRLSISSCLNLLYFLVIFNNTLFFFSPVSGAARLFNGAHSPFSSSSFDTGDLGIVTSILFTSQ